jgi:hypothetical protein
MSYQAGNEHEAVPHSVESESLLTQRVNDVKPAGSVWRRLTAVAVLLALAVLGYSASSAYSSSDESLYEDHSPMDLSVPVTASLRITSMNSNACYDTTGDWDHIKLPKGSKVWTPQQCFAKAAALRSPFVGMGGNGTKCAYPRAKKLTDAPAANFNVRNLDSFKCPAKCLLSAPDFYVPCGDPNALMTLNVFKLKY